MADRPRRIQMRRDRPWRADHPDAVIVARPHRWANPYRIGDPDPHSDCPKMTPEIAVYNFRRHHLNAESRRLIREELAGRDLACWCPLDQPCHADVLLEIANGEAGR